MRRMAACLAAAPVMGMTAGRATVGTSTISQPGLSSGSGTNGGAHVGGVWGEAILRLGSTTIIQCPVFILPICLELSILCLMKNGIYQGKYCLVHCFTIGLIYSWPCVAHHLYICVFLGGIVINVVVGAEVATLCKLEEGCGVVIDEMPINVCAPSLKHPIWNLPISFTNKFENPVAEVVVWVGKDIRTFCRTSCYLHSWVGLYDWWVFFCRSLSCYDRADPNAVKNCVDNFIPLVHQWVQVQAQHVFESA